MDDPDAYLQIKYSTFTAENAENLEGRPNYSERDGPR